MLKIISFTAGYFSAIAASFLDITHQNTFEYYVSKLRFHIIKWKSELFQTYAVHICPCTTIFYAKSCVNSYISESILCTWISNMFAQIPLLTIQPVGYEINCAQEAEWNNTCIQYARSNISGIISAQHISTCMYVRLFALFGIELSVSTLGSNTYDIMVYVALYMRIIDIAVRSISLLLFWLSMFNLVPS